jgi:hypothetical protein
MKKALVVLIVVAAPASGAGWLAGCHSALRAGTDHAGSGGAAGGAGAAPVAGPPDGSGGAGVIIESLEQPLASDAAMEDDSGVLADGGSGQGGGPVADSSAGGGPFLCTGAANHDQFRYAPGYTPDPSLLERVASTLAGMSLQDKAAQMRGMPFDRSGGLNDTATTTTTRSHRSSPSATALATPPSSTARSSCPADAFLPLSQGQGSFRCGLKWTPFVGPKLARAKRESALMWL